MKTAPSSQFYELAPEQIALHQDICRQLSAPQKTLPVKYLYDEEGRRLLERLSDAEEYYLDRAELAIMRQYAREMVQDIGARAVVIEYGCGSKEKLRLLLNHLPEPSGYIGVDLAGDSLNQTTAALHDEYPGLEIHSVCADFTKLLPLPIVAKDTSRKVIYFSGSGIGELHPHEAKLLLRNMRLALGKTDGLLIGIDLKKDEQLLTRAYNDKTGYAQALHTNILNRINRELEGNFQPAWFNYQAFYDQARNRMTMSLVSQYSHIVNVWDQQFSFHAGESIHTEYAYKYTVEEFTGMVEEAGFQLNKHWTDSNQHFAVLSFTVKPSRS